MKSLPFSQSVCFLALSALSAPSVLAAPFPQEVIDRSVQQQTQQNILQQQQQQQLQQQQQPSQDVFLDSAPNNQIQQETQPATDEVCFPIQQVSLVGESAEKFQFALDAALRQSNFQPGDCLGAQAINRIMTLAQNAVIGRGYTTTRILAAPQDLKSGRLELTVIAGKISSIRVELANKETTHVERISAFQNEFPTAAGDILNLRNLEQGLENLKRIPSAEADIRIEPGAQPNESDVVIVWRQRLLPFRLSIGADDSGSKATGKYQGNITLSLDNPLGLSDLFYVSYGRDLGHKNTLTDYSGIRTDSGTRNYALHYSFPFGKWLWAVNHNGYRYHQAVAGLSENYDYNGRSHNTDIGFTRLLYRDARRKTHFGMKVWWRESQSFVNDAEIDVQRRRTAGWSASLTHKEYFGNAILNLAINYKRGTGMQDALRAPEEKFGEGTSRMKIISATADFNQPFQIGRQAFAYDTSIHAQWNKSPLTPQDKLAIGGRYTVRGFDGELSLSAERGWYWQNTLAWQYRNGHQVYIGADVGHVSGPSAEWLLGQTLAGAVLGLKGQFNLGGNLYYDIFAGRSLHKPTHFPADKPVFGFNLNYSF